MAPLTVVTVVAVVAPDRADQADAFRKSVSTAARQYFGAPGGGRLARTDQWVTRFSDDAWPNQTGDDVRRLVGIAALGNDADPERLLPSIQQELREWILRAKELWLRDEARTTADDAKPRDIGLFHFGYPDFLIPFGSQSDCLRAAEPEFAVIGGVAMRTPYNTTRKKIGEALALAARPERTAPPVRPRPLCRSLLLDVIVAPDRSDDAGALNEVLAALRDRIARYAPDFTVVEGDGPDVTPIVVTNDHRRLEADDERIILLREDPSDVRPPRYGLCFFEQLKQPPYRHKPREMIVAPRAHWVRWSEYVLLGMIGEAQASR